VRGDKGGWTPHPVRVTNSGSLSEVMDFALHKQWVRATLMHLLVNGERKLGLFLFLSVGQAVLLGC
jgi:hypothetical protein